MSGSLPEPLRPDPGERGLASSDPESLGSATVAAWDAFIAGVVDLDPDQPTRVDGSSVRDLLVPLGVWPESRTLANILQDAADNRTWGPSDEARPKAILDAHRSASMVDIVAALELARSDTAAWFAGDRAWPVATWGLRMAPSPVGPLPVLTMLHGVCYQLAITQLDLREAGAQIDENLLGLGLLALIDMMGAFIARTKATGALSAVGTQLVVGTGSTNGDWRTAVLDSTDPKTLRPVVAGATEILLDVTAGRANAPMLYSQRQLKVHDLTALAGLLPVLEHVPGIPAVATFGRAAAVITKAADLFAKLPFRRD